MTAGIIVFGVVFSQMLPRDALHIREEMRLIRVEQISLLLILFTVFYLNALLRKSLLILARYLIVKNASE